MIYYCPIPPNERSWSRIRRESGECQLKLDAPIRANAQAQNSTPAERRETETGSSQARGHARPGPPSALVGSLSAAKIISATRDNLILQRRQITYTSSPTF